MKRFYPVIFITAIITISVSLISIVNFVTSNHTQFQQDYETVEQFKGIFQNISYYKYDDETEVYTIYNDNKKLIGYGFYAVGRGYGGYIRILVGLENKDTIMNIIVILHHETNDYWNLLIKHEFFNQFFGLKIEDCYLVRDNGRVDSVTRATTSAKAVVDTVRETALKKVALMNLT
jgi:Na+-translocating ferredoxin:NAD+ oxidoreductase RnfG subunit